MVLSPFGQRLRRRAPRADGAGPCGLLPGRLGGLASVRLRPRSDDAGRSDVPVVVPKHLWANELLQEQTSCFAIGSRRGALLDRGRCPKGTHRLPLPTNPDTQPLLRLPRIDHLRGARRCALLSVGHSETWARRAVRDHWMIVGGESGPGARSLRPEWVRRLRDQALRAQVPFFFKQWGGVRKKATGRVLDGRTWDQLPAAAGM
jgi:hypothetical protein